MMGRRAPAGWRVLVTGTALALAGCSSATPYAPSAAQLLQRQVLAVATQARAGQYARAIAQLTELQTSDDAALKKGELTVDRHNAIASEISQIRADLATLEAQAQVRRLQQQTQLLQRQAAQRAPRPGPAGGGKHDHGGKGGD